MTTIVTTPSAHAGQQPVYATRWRAEDYRLAVDYRFDVLAASWEQETAGMSFVEQRRRHPAYAQLRDMGQAIVPMILRRIESNPSDWFDLLFELTDQDQHIDPADAGDVIKMTDAWVEWGKQNGLLEP